jgi:3-oxoacyl-[acyl-carrier-protein] synthase III
VGRHWPLCTIPGGGSRFPHQPDMQYFEGLTSSLRGIIIREAGDIVEAGFACTGWTREEVRHVFVHQVSVGTFQAVAREIGIPVGRFTQVVSRYGNMAAASIPVAMHEALQTGQLRKEDKILVIGLAAGVSISVQFMIW